MLRNIYVPQVLISFFLFPILLSLCFCSKNSEKGTIKSIYSYEQFSKIIDEAGTQLIAFDLYANWCVPCQILSPQLEKLSKAYKDKVTFYKVNVDHNPQITQSLMVTGIPQIVFIKEKKIVETLTGIHPMQKYVDIINKYQ